jgi:hypothetical protein
MSSASRFGGRWQDYLAVHELIDSTKACCADPRHRMVLHSVDFGAAVARVAFPDRRDTDALVRQHVIEDLGSGRTLDQWLGLCRRAKLPRLFPGVLPLDVERLIAEEVELVGSAARDEIATVCSLLTLPMTFAPNFGAESLCILGISFGPALVRRILGPAREIGSVIFDPALCAERLVYRLYRAVPPMTAVVQALSSSHPSGRQT